MMYRIQSRKKDVRIYVRNKARYNPEAKERNFLFVDITDFAGTTIGDIKENVRRQTKGSVKIDELFLNNISLADDRSVAHYNLEDGSILETTSNPLWVSCLYIKASEVKQQQQLYPGDEDVQKWTSKSLPKKYTIIGILLNSSNAFQSQPPHFPTLQDFVQYLEQLGKKGATMHPNYTRADLAKMELEFHRDFERKFDDPIAAFIDHHAVQLGFINLDEAERKLRQPADTPLNRGIMNYASNSGAAGTANDRARTTGVGGAGNRGVINFPSNSGAATTNDRARAIGVGSAGNRNSNKRQVQVCEDCETSLAVIYCSDCQNAADGTGISLCKRCSDLLHAGATRRRHNIADISQAPKSSNSKPYVPRAFLAPFSILLAMFSALSDTVPKLSMTEDDVKSRAQYLTDTDLQDKQNGKYVGGFDCMENCLIAKGLVKKEASRTPTYALTDLGHALGEKLFLFYRTLFAYLSSCQLPKLQDTISTSCIGNRKICLLIDENEREKGRLLRFAEDKGIDAQTRFLPAGDYVWILTPPMIDTRQKYTGNQSDTEVVLPFIVERKSWEDFENSVNSTRFQRQVNNMLGSGVKNCFYLMEGSPGSLRYNATQQHQHQLKSLVEKLIYDYGFYVNYTSSWMKSAQWLLWFTQLIVEAFKQGKLADSTIPYSEYSSRVAVLNGGHPTSFHGNQNRRTHTWPAQLFVDHIFRDELGDRTLLRTVKEDLGLQGSETHLLVIQGLEQYNKKRQSTLNKCCTEVHAAPQQAEEIVDRMIGNNIHNMVHYDITCYKQLYIQVMTGVYVMRTETDKETEQAHEEFMTGPKPLPQVLGSKRAPKQPSRKQKSPKIIPPPTADILADIDSFSKTVHADDDNVMDSLERLRQNSDTSHDLPPGCRVTNYSASRFGGQSKSRTESAGSFKVFSGTGFTLGSSSSSHSNSRPSASITCERQVSLSEINVKGDISRSPLKNAGNNGHHTVDLARDNVRRNMDPAGNSLRRNNNVERIADESVNSTLRDFSAGIPVSETVSRSVTKTGDKVASAISNSTGSFITDNCSNFSKEDFANSQNEDEILQAVLNKSKEDVISFGTESQEDPEFQLAMRLSREENQISVVNQDKNISGQSASIYSSDKPDLGNSETIEIQDDSQECVDEELMVALGKSKEPSKPKNRDSLTVNLNSYRDLSVDDVNSSIVTPDGRQIVNIEVSRKDDDEESQLKLAIEMSKVINTPEKINKKGTDNLFIEAIERSLPDHIPLKLNDASDHLLKIALEKSKLERSVSDLPEDFLLKEAIERSKLDHTPKKAADHDFELKQAIERSKTDHTPVRSEHILKDTHLKIAIERSLVDQSPKRISVKRKLDADETCDIGRKLTKTSREQSVKKGELRGSDSESISQDFGDVCSSQTELVIPRTTQFDTEVIQIESQSQEIETERAGLEDRIDSSSTCIQQNDSMLNLSESFMEDISNIQRNNDMVNNTEGSDTDDEADLVPPSPNKSSCNLSQLSINCDTNGTQDIYKIREVCNKRSEPMASDLNDEVEKYGKESEPKEQSYEVETRYNEMKFKKSDFSLKTTLFRFVDENSSDDSSSLDSDGEGCDYDGDSVNRLKANASDNDSAKSVKDIFTQPDHEALSDPFLRKSFHEQDKITCCNLGENVSDNSSDDILVRQSVLNQNVLTLSSKKVERSGKSRRQSDSDRHSYECGKTAPDFVANVKKEKIDDTEKETEDVSKSCKSTKKDTQKECDKKPIGSRGLLMNQESIDYIPSVDVARREFSDICTYDSEMDEIDFNPDLDDSDNDPTYKAGNGDSGSSECSCSGSDEDDIDELISKVDPEFLPQIRRPKKRRKQTPQKVYPEEMSNKPKSLPVKIKQEKNESFDAQVKVETDNPETRTEMDAELAKMLDKQINRSKGKSVSNAGSTVFDDELFARQVQAELELELTVNRNRSVDGDMAAKKDQLSLNENYSHPDTEDLAKELQRREMEKIEKMKRTLQEDERLARIKQNNPEIEKDKSDVKDIDLEKPVIPRNYKKLFAEDRALREKTATQVDEYRKLQAERYQLARNQGPQSGSARLSGNLTIARHTDGLAGSSLIGRSATDRQTHSLFNSQTFDKPSQSLTGNLYTSHPQTSQVTPGSHTYQSQSSSFPFTQSDAGQLTPYSQSKPSAERNANSTCGNCGEKGHTRVNPSCPKYHTAEESARREAQQERRRLLQEEKKKEELENINMLARHQKVILEMNNQLEAEMSTIQGNLHRRALELEKQVNSRVKKIENAEKRKKKK